MTILADIRQSARGLLRTPGFSSIAVLTLALAIGANTAIYSALQALVLHPLPFKDADRLVYVYHRNPTMGGTMLTPPPAAIEQWRTATNVFEAIESFTGQSVVLSGGDEPEDLNVSKIRPSLLAMLGVAPRLGRALTDDDTRPAADRVLLIGESLWRRRYGADPHVIGRTITLSDTPYTIIGVMPEQFALPMGSDLLWAAARPDDAQQPGQSTIAKLQRGVTQADAQRELDRLGTLNTGEFAGWSGYLFAPREFTGTESALLVLAGAVGLLLVIACVNVANLMLSRNSSRRREVAVRHALGAARSQLVRYLLAESAVLSIAGGLLGVLLAQWILAAMTALRPRNLDALARIHVDGRVLVFAAAVSLLTGLLFGLLPALRASRVNLHDVLASGGRGSTASGSGIRQVLSVAQIAIALVLIVGAMLLVRSFEKLTNVDLGIDPDHVVSMRIALPANRYPAGNKEARGRFFDDLVASVAALPGVTSAAVGNGIPPEAGIMVGTIQIAGRPADSAPTLLSGGSVSPAFFATLRIPILEGRAFGPGDVETSEPVAIVSHSFAARYWHGASPLGAQLRADNKSPMMTVVGVVGDVKANGVSSRDVGGMQLYLPRAQTKPGNGVIVVRTTGDPAALIPALKARVWALDPRLPARDLLTARQLMVRFASTSRFTLALVLAFALCGLTLAAIGVYGVLALFVGQRLREMGVRIALGASPLSVAGLVSRQTAAMILCGIAAGSLGAFVLTRFMRALLFDISPTDALSFVVAGGVITASAILATLAPVYRATRVDPARVLRAD